MKGPGALTLAVVILCALIPATANSAPRRRARANQSFTSPDQQKVVQVTRKGRVRLNGRLVSSGPGRVLCRPVWRKDSGALAFLQRSRYGMQLVVLPELDPRHPLVWQLPSTADRLRKVFWIAHHKLGVGVKELVPRMVVSWSTPAANLPLW